MPMMYQKISQHVLILLLIFWSWQCIGSANKGSNRVDLFVPNLMDDTIDTPASTPNLETTRNSVREQVDLFADATFQSAPSNSETTTVKVRLIFHGFSFPLYTYNF